MARNSKLMYLGIGSLLAGAAIYGTFIYPYTAYFYVDSYKGNEEKVQGLIDKGWIPGWFPLSASNIKFAQTTDDVSFMWVTFSYNTEDDFLKNCVHESWDRSELPSSDFMERFSDEVTASYKQFIETKPQTYSCKDGNKNFFAGASGDGRVAYMWLP